MLSVKTFGVFLLCTFAATDMITFKPFVKSRYSLREGTRTTTKFPLMKANETAGNLSPETNNQTNTTQNLGTIIDNENSATEVSSLVTVIGATPKSAEEDETKEIAMENSQTSVVNTKVKTTKSPGTTTQTEWIYDYYASDDESQKKKK